MQVEYRFDDLDLREEPSRGETESDAIPTTTVSHITNVCTLTKLCTHFCCTTI